MRAGFREFALACWVLVFLLWFEAVGQTAAPPEEAAIRARILKLADAQSDVRMAAISSLATSKDGRVAETLEAYRLGSLQLWQERAVMSETVADSPDLLQLRDALTGELIMQDGLAVRAAKADLRSLVASRKERRDVVNAIRVLQLYSLDQFERLSAVKKLGDLRNTEYLDELEELLTSEQDSQIQYRAQESIALIRLMDGAVSVEDRRAVVTELGEMGSARATAPIKALLAAEATPLDEQTRAVCQTALDSINSYQRRVRILGYIFSGLSLGSVLILMALGLSIIFGQMGVINMAHGELMMIGAYATYEIQEAFGHSMPDHPANAFFLVALPVSFLAASFVGLVMERLIVRRLYGRPLETLLATWGVGLILIQAVRICYGDNIGVSSPTWLVGGSEVIPDFQVPYNRLFIIGLTAGCVVFVYWLMNHTKRGLLVRATVQNREMASALGVNTRYEDGFTFAFGAGLAGVAGCALTLIGGVTPDMGQNYIVDSFLVVVTGGVGEIVGVVCAGLGLGVFTKTLEPVFSTIWGKVLILSFVVIFIQYRPAGLFPPKGRLADV
ncbi:MAG: urea ABC transporter permease subunit UrtB [Pirellulaceae bacterium]|nr:urea ABC transporter permease subunit UrtB [Pirellulaceae bacterium]